jgi:hypothetical protein
LSWSTIPLLCWLLSAGAIARAPAGEFKLMLVKLGAGVVEIDAVARAIDSSGTHFGCGAEQLSEVGGIHHSRIP